MERRDARVRRWLETGKHEIQTIDDQFCSEGPEQLQHESADGKSCPSNEDHEQDDDSASSSGITDDSSHMRPPETLIGAYGDWLIPTPSQISEVYNRGLQTWTQLVTSARSLPPDTLPSVSGNPTVMLKDVPSLPSRLPHSPLLRGQPVWHVPDAENDGGGLATDDNNLVLDELYGVHKHVHISYSTPIVCRTSPCTNATMSSPAISILTICWSYILSVRLWELQGKAVVYTRHRINPKPRKSLPSNDLGNVNIDLGRPASRPLVAWLSAVLAPEAGWAAKGSEESDYTPWAALLPSDMQFSLYADGRAEDYQQEHPPTCAEAAQLLAEFCALFGLGKPKRRPGRPRKDVSEPSPVTFAFLAALALPFYRCLKLQPQFPRPIIQRACQVSHSHSDLITSYVNDLPYYMTLSMEPRSVGSTIWSIFWQPEIECNLVSPWLSSITAVLKPIIDAGDVGLLTRVFALRRPRVALWWLGIFLLGSPSISALILRYLNTLEERLGFASMGAPDATTSAWTGSTQSFLDDETVKVYTDLESMVPIADLLKSRYKLRLQDTSQITLAWRPFGFLPKEKIEVGLWPWLEDARNRTYLYWVWWVEEDGAMTKDIQHGFRRDTGRFLLDVADNLKMADVDRNVASATVSERTFRAEPSLQATLRMLSHCMDDIDGEGHLPVDSEDAKTHPWLRGWRGFE